MATMAYPGLPSEASKAMGDAPAHHSDCCLSISRPLMDNLAKYVHAHIRVNAAAARPIGSAGSMSRGVSVTPSPHVLSIGCGSGFLEACLSYHDPLLCVEGVEVNAGLNKHLDGDRYHTVLGTWDLFPGAQEADVWLFVYPREPGLLQKYIDSDVSSSGTTSCSGTNVDSSSMRMLIWLGPCSDWDDYEPVLRTSGFEVEIVDSEEAGLVAYETMAIARRGT